LVLTSLAYIVYKLHILHYEIFKAGDCVEITDGPFKGLSAKVLKSVNERVKVLMEFMNQQHKVNLSVGQCRAIVQ